LTKTIRRPANHVGIQPKPDRSSKEVIAGDIIYVRTYCGPIVKFRVKEVKNGYYLGIVDPKDNKKTYLAGCEPSPDEQICSFPFSKKVTREEYESEDWQVWVVRKKLAKT